MNNQILNTHFFAILCFFALIIGTPFHSSAQQKMFYYLDAIADTNNDVHLFYHKIDTINRFERNFDINHLDLSTNSDSTFLSGIERDNYSSYFKHYDLQFYNNDIRKYTYTSASAVEEPSNYISRFDTIDAFSGFILDVHKKFLTGGSNDTVYARIENITTISKDGGMSWPSQEDFYRDEIPDSLILDFPLTYMSPYNSNMLIGKHLGFFKDTLVVSQDGGINSTVINDTLSTNLSSSPFDRTTENVTFDPDSVTVYLTDIYKSNTDTVLSLFRSSELVNPESWAVVNQFNEFYTPLSSTIETGKIYLWNEHEILVSTDFGETFETLYETPKYPIEQIATAAGRLFLVTPFQLLEIIGNNAVEIKTFTVGIEDFYIQKPHQTILHQNYPNPFNPSTTITFTLPSSSDVSLIVYNLLGQEIYVLIDNEFYSTGEYTVEFSADEHLSTGVYIYRLTADRYTQTKTMTLIK